MYKRDGAGIQEASLAGVAIAMRFSLSPQSLLNYEQLDYRQCTDIIKVSVMLHNILMIWKIFLKGI